MKYRVLKILSFILAVFMLIGVCSSCAASKNNDDLFESSDIYKDTSTEDNVDTEKSTDKEGKEDKEDKEDKQESESDKKEPSDAPEEELKAGDILVYSNKSYKVKFISHAPLVTFEDNFYSSFCNLFKSKVGKAPDCGTDFIVPKKQPYSGPAILVGKTLYNESKEVYKTLKPNEAKAVVSGDKYVLAYSSEAACFALFNKIKAVFKEKATADRIVIDSSWNISLTVDPSQSSVSKVPNKVMAVDQAGKRVVVYDLDKYSSGKTLDDLEVWSLKAGHAAGLKYREGSVFGDVVIVAGDRSGIYAYPSGKTIWYTDNPGNNTHSIELLPSGNIVIANSTGNSLRFFKSSAVKNNDSTTAAKYTDYPLEGAHGVLWDPEYNVLWALGSYDLKAYSLQGSGASQKLVERTDLSIKLPYGRYHGHDLSPDYTSKRYLYITVNYCAMRFDKETRTLSDVFPYSGLTNATAIKGFSNNAANHFFLTGTAGGAGCFWDNEWYESWCTDTIYYCAENNGVVDKIAFKSKKSAFYKVRVFCGAYQ